MEGQFISILEGDMKLKLIQIDCYGMNFGVFGHVAPVPPHLIEKTEDFIRIGDNPKKSDGSNRQEPYHRL